MRRALDLDVLLWRRRTDLPALPGAPSAHLQWKFVLVPLWKLRLA
jgi:7,8-dihydro-6-hydroxymethylpterin-pyrophosphokinase